jgi:acetoin utilization deacetylase AcuC-like enzyme
LAPGTGDGPWNAAVDELVAGAVAHGAEALVVSLGVDAAAGDPESPLAVSRSGFAAAGRSLAAPGLPTVLVQEGGYDLDTLGDLVLAVLDGFEE